MSGLAARCVRVGGAVRECARWLWSRMARQEAWYKGRARRGEDVKRLGETQSRACLLLCQSNDTSLPSGSKVRLQCCRGLTTPFAVIVTSASQPPSSATSGETLIRPTKRRMLSKSHTASIAKSPNRRITTPYRHNGRHNLPRPRLDSHQGPQRHPRQEGQRRPVLPRPAEPEERLQPQERGPDCRQGE